MRLMKLTGTLAAALVLSLAAAPRNAAAGVIQVGNGCIGFSNCDDSAFVAAASGLLLNFNDMNQPADGLINGSTYSADFVLSSDVGAFGGVNTFFVQQGFTNTNQSEVGPAPGYTGTLVISFATGQRAVGFGTVEFGDDLAEKIRVYNGATLLGTFDPSGSPDFNYEGFIATGGDKITRIELDGNFFAVQNIKYGVPEPVSLSLLGLGLAGVVARRRARR